MVPNVILFGFSCTLYSINALFVIKTKIIKKTRDILPVIMVPPTSWSYFGWVLGRKKADPICIVSKLKNPNGRTNFVRRIFHNLCRRIYVFLLYDFPCLEVALPVFLFRITCTGFRESTIHTVTSLFILIGKISEQELAK